MQSQKSRPITTPNVIGSPGLTSVLMLDHSTPEPWPSSAAIILAPMAMAVVESSDVPCLVEKADVVYCGPMKKYGT